MAESSDTNIASQNQENSQQRPINLTFVDAMRQDFEKTLESMDTEVKELVQQGREAAALTLFGSKVQNIIAIRETLSAVYGMFFRELSVLERFGSERLKQVGSDLLPIYEIVKDTGASLENIEQRLLSNFRRQGIKRTHWWLKEVIVCEIQYMLDTLQILVEPEFMPFHDVSQTNGDDTNDKPDRYISPEVKLAVWRRDQGKCVQCGSREKLEYDHIIPVSKGGSNTERNIQLLCEKCNREKAARIDY